MAREWRENTDGERLDEGSGKSGLRKRLQAEDQPSGPDA